MASISYDGYQPEGRSRPPRGGRGVGGYDPAPSGMPGTDTNPNAGYPGPTPDPLPTPSMSQQSPFNFGNTTGLDQGKFTDPNKHGFKYDVMRALSSFDPRGGFTSDVLKALNALGYGTFSSRGGDKLSLTGATNSKEAADFTDQDWIFAHDAQNDATKWSFGGGGFVPPSPQAGAYGPDPTMSALPWSMPQPSPWMAQPQQSQVPAIFSDQAFWQQLVRAMQPQYAPGYSNSPMPSFGGAYSPTRQQPVQQGNPQIEQLLSQLFAGLGGR